MSLVITPNGSSALLLILSALIVGMSTADGARLVADTQRAKVAVSTHDAFGESGIEGVVNIRPIRPHQTVGSSNFMPYQATVQVLDGNGRAVTSFESNANGEFHVVLPPGKYVLRPQSPGLYPRASEQTIVVSPGKMTQVRIIYDAGIR